MKKYIAAKPCSFGGKRYIIGETIPTEAVDPARAPALIKYGTIQEVEVPEAPAAPEAPATGKADKANREKVK